MIRKVIIIQNHPFVNYILVYLKTRVLSATQPQSRTLSRQHVTLWLLESRITSHRFSLLNPVDYMTLFLWNTTSLFLYTDCCEKKFSTYPMFNKKDRRLDMVWRQLSSATELLVQPIVWKERRIMGWRKVCYQDNFPRGLLHLTTKK